MSSLQDTFSIRKSRNKLLAQKYSDFKTCHDPSLRSRNYTQKYKGFNDDDPSVMQVNAVPHSELLAVQGQNSLLGNIQDSNQIQDMNAPRLNQKGNLIHYKGT